MMTERESKEGSEKKLFCRLCGKYRPAEEFKIITLAAIGGIAVKYNGCKVCDMVIENAKVIIKETTKRFIDEAAKIQLEKSKGLIKPDTKLVTPNGIIIRKS
jgi:Pyruvate/2-oxoacid:ferredoxin oxidoreductase delta subunit